MSDEKTTMTFRVEKSLQDAYDQAAKPTTAPAPNCCATSCASTSSATRRATC